MGGPYLVRITAVLTYASGSVPGNTGHKLEISAALCPNGQLDPEAVQRQAYSVRQMLYHEEIWSGFLMLDGTSWILNSADDNGPVWYVSASVLRPGTYFTLSRPSGDMLTFQVINVTRLWESLKTTG